MRIPFASKITKISVYLIAIAFSVKCMKEPDFWWQWLTGDWIISHGQVPHADPFSYTMRGTPWVNIKWLSEVLFSIWNKLFSVELSVMIQVLVSCAMVFILNRMAKRNKIADKNTFIIFLLLFLNISEYRFNTRPEMFTHLFLLCSLYIITSYLRKPSSIIYFLIPLQIIWQNTHEAFGIGIVLVLMLLFSLIFSSRYDFWRRNQSVIITLIAMILCTVINPYGLKLLASPIDIFSQLGNNKYTFELNNFLTPKYWDKTSYLFWAMILMTLVLGLRYKIKFERNALMIFYVLLSLGFLYLSLSAHRNIILGMLALSPMIMHMISRLDIKWPSKSDYIMVVVMILLYVGITTDKYYEIFGERYHFGLEVLSIQNPTGASAFIRSKNYQGKEIFADYIVSSYFMKYNKGFESYIDLRDLDIFPTDFFTHYIHVVNNMDSFYHESQKFDWKLVVILRHTNTQLHSYLFNDSLFACVYVDPVAAVYEKTDDFTRDDIFTSVQPVPRSGYSRIMQLILAPWHGSYNYDQYDVDIDAAEYYFAVGRLQIAENRLMASEYLYGQTQRSQNLAESIQHIKWQLNQNR